MSELSWDDGPGTPPDGGDGQGRGLVTLNYLLGVLRRRRHVWLAAAGLGLVAALGLHVLSPPPREAATSVLVTHGIGDDPERAMATDAELAKARTVAARVRARLDLPLTTDDFRTSYAVSGLTDRVLRITAQAPSDEEAVHRADALAQGFLTFREQQIERRQRLVLEDLQPRIDGLLGEIDDLNGRIESAQTDSSEAAIQRLDDLESQRGEAATELQQLQQTVKDTQLETVSMVGGTQVLDPAAVLPASSLKALAVDLATGLVGGLTLGVGFVLVAALLSDRLRRREDVAAALGVPVRLSVGHVSTGDRRDTVARLTRRAPRPALVHAVRHLEHVLDGLPARPALAVVAVDDTAAPARVVTTLAASLTRAGQRTVLADLTGQGALAQQFALTEPGAHVVPVEGSETPVTLVLPPEDDLAPRGPLAPGLRETDPEPWWAGEEAAEAWEQAQVRLTLVHLDPAVGADHLPGWATDAVAVVTSGRSNATRVHGTAELVRLSGTRLRSGVLLDSDVTDDSLGVPTAPPASASGRLDLGVVNR
jgi:capsular polysaccharide biosynthesis protein